MRALVDMGVDGVVTDRADAALGALGDGIIGVRARRATGRLCIDWEIVAA